jgi:C-5 cytosine-specific DNA methylase
VSVAKPICIDLYCGLGGWAEGFLAEGYHCRGYDIEAHDYGTGGYPGELILRDVRSITGEECKDAAVIVASPPCQAYSYRAMPWKRAKALPPPDNTLFNECFRIQREASEAAGHYIPLIVENMRGAQKWVGRARWNYGSFYLWGDVPALMPVTLKVAKVPGFRFDGSGKSFQTASVDGLKMGWDNSERGKCRRNDGTKIPGISGFRNADGKKVGFNVAAAQRYCKGVKFSQSGDAWFDRKPRDKMLGDKGPAAYGSRSNSRKAASAMIAKIPYPLALHIARCFRPNH